MRIFVYMEDETVRNNFWLCITSIDKSQKSGGIFITEIVLTDQIRLSCVEIWLVPMDPSQTMVLSYQKCNSSMGT